VDGLTTLGPGSLAFGFMAVKLVRPWPLSSGRTNFTAITVSGLRGCGRATTPQAYRPTVRESQPGREIVSRLPAAV